MPCPIHTALAQFLSEHRAARIFVAFSGGLDSSVLLHALATLPAIDRNTIHAAHIDHGLHADSADWARQCALFAARLSVPMHTRRIKVVGVAEFGPEGAARRARYAALGALLDRDDLLLTAHHADDQAETLLLRALRSAGLEGMAAMRPIRVLGKAHLGRPFLDVPRTDILAYARQHALQWIEDSSNQNEAFDRNFLRHQVLPLIESRWTRARRALAESARHLRAAASIARVELDRRLSQARGMTPDRLRIDALRHHSDEEATTLIRHWLLDCNLAPPPPRVLEDLLLQLSRAAPDRIILIRWPGGELRRYRGELFALPPESDSPLVIDCEWVLPAPLTLGDGRKLCIEGSTPARRLRVRSRQQGARLTIAENRPRRELRLLFQEHGVPPWTRDRLPYLYDGDVLVAVGDKFLDHEFQHWLRASGAKLVLADAI